jgi:S1/P1 Nuclease
VRLLVMLLLCALSGRALAWSNEAHRITAHIARAHLTPDAREALARLIPDADLASVATFMDVYREALKREHPGSDRWHFDNRPLCGGSDPAQYCGDGHCASAKIPQFLAVLADPRASVAARTDAVKFVVHMMADAHQPLHVVDDHDWGGNKKWARFGTEQEPRNLHFMWDVEFVNRAMRGKTEAALAREWTEQYASQIAEWKRGEHSAWMQEIEKIGRRIAYGLLPGMACPTDAGAATATVVADYDGRAWGTAPKLLPLAYADAAVDLIPSLLTRAGVRMAAVLNVALDQRTAAKNPLSGAVELAP